MLLIVSPFPMRAFVPFDTAIVVQGECRTELSRVLLSRSPQSHLTSLSSAKLLLFDSATKKTHPTSSENLLKK